MCLGSCHLCLRLTWSCWFLISDMSSLGCFSHLGSVAVNERYLCLCSFAVKKKKRNTAMSHQPLQPVKMSSEIRRTQLSWIISFCPCSHHLNPNHSSICVYMLAIWKLNVHHSSLTYRWLLSRVEDWGGISKQSPVYKLVWWDTSKR